jgi:hypothetical protein
MRLVSLLVAAFLLFPACTGGDTWVCPSGPERVRFRQDVKECKVYAREVTARERKNVKIPSTSPHGGVQEAFLVYGMFQEVFNGCMGSRGWKKGDS